MNFKELGAKAMLIAGATLVGMSVAGIARAEAYPDKPVRWVVGFPPGGGTDVLARTVGTKLAERLKGQVIVDNKPGAGGMLAAEQIAKSQADGYTLLTGDISIMVLNPAVHSQARYKPIEDFVPIAMMARFPLVIATHPNSGVKSIQDLVSTARSNNAAVVYGSAGVGTPHHVAMELFLSQTGLSAQHIPYKGDAPTLQDLAGGQVPVAIVAPSLSIPYFQAGKLIPLAVTSDKRLAQLPSVPSLKELGYVKTGVYAWQGLVAPKGTPAAVVKKLESEVIATLKDPVVAQRLADLAMEPLPSTGREMAAHIQSEKAIWEALIKARGIKND